MWKNLSKSAQKIFFLEENLSNQRINGRKINIIEI